MKPELTYQDCIQQDEIEQGGILFTDGAKLWSNLSRAVLLRILSEGGATIIALALASRGCLCGRSSVALRTASTYVAHLPAASPPASLIQRSHNSPCVRPDLHPTVTVVD